MPTLEEWVSKPVLGGSLLLWRTSSPGSIKEIRPGHNQQVTLDSSLFFPSKILVHSKFFCYASENRTLNLVWGVIL